MKATDPGHLSLSAHSRATYISPAFFALIRREINEINDLLQGQQRFTSTHIRDDPLGDNEFSKFGSTANTDDSDPLEQESASELYSDTPMFLSSGMHSTRHTSHVDSRQLTEGLPTQAQCEMIIDAYMSGYHTISPMIHGPSIRKGISSLFRS